MSSPTLAARVLPPSLLVGGRARYLIERNILVYRRSWIIILSGFFEPVFYLFSLGVGVGALVGDVDLGNGRFVTYAAFVAPAMLASSAMNGAIYEATLNFFFKLRYARTYEAILATPLSAGDVAVGEIGWSLMRGGIYSAGFLVVMAVMGLVPSVWGILALPASLVIGLAFGAVGMAASSFMKSWQDFDLAQLVILPLFLFSATFYPLSVYPPVLQAIAHISPLYHGVELIRSLTLGHIGLDLLVHIGVLVLLGAVGVAITARRIGHVLLK